MFDMTGLAISIVVAGTIVAIGAGIDSLLLDRQRDWFNFKALQWWNYFDNLKIVDLPRRGVELFLKMKTLVLGKSVGAAFFFRACLLSMLMTALAIYGGTIFGLYFYEACSRAVIGEPVLSAAWRMIGGADNLMYLGPTNLVFDVATILTTTLLLSFAMKKNDYILGLMIFLDMLACIFLFESLIYVSDTHRNLRLAFNGFGTAIHEAYVEIANANCTIGLILLPALIYSSTIIIPTIIYLLIIAALFMLRESFKGTKWFIMHVLERSVEDAKKTMFVHVGVALGILVAVAKAIVEVVAILNNSA